MTQYVIKKAEIEAMEGLAKKHFLNQDARRTNRSLGDLTGLEALGFHIIEVPPGRETTEYHVHYHEEECVYVLEGRGRVDIGDEQHDVEAGDFIGYRAGGDAHTMRNTGDSTLRCIVVGQRLTEDIADYPRLGKRLFRSAKLGWNLVDIDALSFPQAGQKK